MTKTTTKSAKSTKSAKATQPETVREDVYKVKAHELLQKIREIIEEGNARQIVIEDKNGKVLFTIPVTFGVLGALLAPWFAGLGAVVAVISECTIRVER
jgi:flagellar basal body P-ring protein FlgI